MKIIAVGMNYAQHNKELGHTQVNREPVIFMKPDSAILKDGKPFFVPDFSAEVHYETEVVVRICRLGKNIAPRFAHRYYDAVTVGIDFTARDLQRKFREAGNPWELCKGFDNSAAIGTFIPLEQAGGDLQQLNFHLDIDGKEVQRGNTSGGCRACQHRATSAGLFRRREVAGLLYPLILFYTLSLSQRKNSGISLR